MGQSDIMDKSAKRQLDIAGALMQANVRDEARRAKGERYAREAESRRRLQHAR